MTKKLLSRRFLMRKPKWALAILITILAFQSILQARANSTWNAQVVDPRGYGGQVAIDSHDNPHIVYNVDFIIDDGKTTSLNYARWTGKNWTTQTIEEQSIGGIIALDSNNEPHILYKNLNNDNLKYATWNGTNWAIQTVTSSRVSRYAMAIDSSDKPHIVYSYSDYSNNTYFTSLMYTIETDLNWSVQTIDTSQSSYGLVPSSVVLDSNDYPHIIYGENVEFRFPSKSYLTHNVEYAVWTGSSWRIQTAASNASSTVGSIGNLVLDSEGNPHFCYIHENFMYLPDYGTFMVRDALNYVYWNGSAWLVEAIDSKPDNIYYGQFDLKLDHNNNPIVYFYKENYQNTTDSGLIYANLIGPNWNLQIVGSHNFNSIAFDSHENPHIIYDVWLGGSIRGAPIRSSLTYASLETTQVLTPTSLLIIIIAVTTVILVLAVLVLVYKVRRKGAKLSAHHVDPITLVDNS